MVDEIYFCVRIFVTSFGVFLELDLLFVNSNLHKGSALRYACMVRQGDENCLFSFKVFAF